LVLFIHFNEKIVKGKQRSFRVALLKYADLRFIHSVKSRDVWHENFA